MGPDNIGDDDPVLLREAPKLFFRHGGMTLSALRTEARKGRLSVIRIAGKDFVTRRAIKDMLELCRVKPPEVRQRANAHSDCEPQSLTAQDATVRLATLRNGLAKKGSKAR